MNKIVLLGDTHFGVRNDSKAFHKYYEKFYRDNLFPYLDEHKINTVVQLGDLFDRRKYINFLSLSESRRYFFDPLYERNIDLYALIGNHDIFWKESLSINSPDLLLKDYSNINLITEPTTLDIYGFEIDAVPWICKENEKDVYDFIVNSTSKVCVGHFEIKGFELSKGVENHEGLDRNIFKRYNAVYSGHFHTRSSSGNITYLGTPYELFWNDFQDPKGFYVLDTDTLDIEFIKNPNEMFVKYYYNEEKEDPRSVDKSFAEDKFVKVIVVDKKDFGMFDNFIDAIYKHNPVEVKIIEDLTEFESSALNDNINLEDTMTLLSEYVDGIETDADKERLKGILKELYVEAHDYEET